MMLRNCLACVIALGVIAMPLSGCEKKGPAEKAGEQVDQAASKAGKKTEEAGENIQDKAGD